MKLNLKNTYCVNVNNIEEAFALIKWAKGNGWYNPLEDWHSEEKYRRSVKKRNDYYYEFFDRGRSDCQINRENAIIRQEGIIAKALNYYNNKICFIFEENKIIYAYPIKINQDNIVQWPNSSVVNMCDCFNPKYNKFRIYYKEIKAFFTKDLDGNVCVDVVKTILNSPCLLEQFSILGKAYNYRNEYKNFSLLKKLFKYNYFKLEKLINDSWKNGSTFFDLDGVNMHSYELKEFYKLDSYRQNKLALLNKIYNSDVWRSDLRKGYETYHCNIEKSLEYDELFIDLSDKTVLEIYRIIQALYNESYKIKYLSLFTEKVIKFSRKDRFVCLKLNRQKEVSIMNRKSISEEKEKQFLQVTFNLSKTMITNMSLV